MTETTITMEEAMKETNVFARNLQIGIAVVGFIIISLMIYFR